MTDDLTVERADVIDGELSVEFSDGVVHVQLEGNLKVSESSLTAAHKHAANPTTGFKGNQLALVRKFITLRIRG